MKELAKIDSRNYGIDLLRIVSMFFIVLLHSFGHGGLLNGLDMNSTQYKAVYFFEISSHMTFFDKKLLLNKSAIELITIPAPVSKIISGLPPVLYVTTGVPHAIASKFTVG